VNKLHDSNLSKQFMFMEQYGDLCTLHICIFQLSFQQRNWGRGARDEMFYYGDVREQTRSPSQLLYIRKAPRWRAINRNNLPAHGTCYSYSKVRVVM
jgi:hypothetical protein